MKYSNNFTSLDEDFAGESFYAPLWRTNVMNRVLMVIQDNIPEVTILCLRFLFSACLMIYLYSNYLKQNHFRWQR